MVGRNPSVARQVILQPPTTSPVNNRSLLRTLIQVYRNKTVKGLPEGLPSVFLGLLLITPFSPSELLARVASMQQQLVDAQVSSLRDR
jgi:hypothetical protein